MLLDRSSGGQADQTEEGGGGGGGLFVVRGGWRCAMVSCRVDVVSWRRWCKVGEEVNSFDRDGHDSPCTTWREEGGRVYVTRDG